MNGPSTKLRTNPSTPDPNMAAAREAGLRYVADTTPGITRANRRGGKDFDYKTPEGKPLKDEETLARIRSLVIPPAWTDVWICPHANGHIQATGRDARGRKQYRYHPKWRETRDGNKFGRMIAFARALPDIRKRVHLDLSRSHLPREKVLAAVVKLLETTLIRVGNDEYAQSNKSFGLTTLRDRHADIDGHTVRFSFKGKSGVKHDIDFSDQRLAHVIEKCQDLPGEELFQYVDDDGKVCDVGSADVNDYLRKIAGEEFTAKDFRTWAGTVLAAMALHELEPHTTQRQAKKNIVSAVESVAKKLGNTQAVCRKCYIHPAILDSYLEGTLVQTLRRRIQKRLDKTFSGAGNSPSAEAAVLAVLQQRLVSTAKSGIRARRKAG